MLIRAITKVGHVGGANFTPNWNFWNKSKQFLSSAFNDGKLKAYSSLIYGNLRVYWMQTGLKEF